MPTLRNSVELTEVIEWEDGNSKRVEDYLASEEPLEIRLGSRPLTVTMRTPGHDRELAAGFLWTEGLIDAHEQIVVLRQDESETGTKSNVVEVELEECAIEPAELQRNFFAASGCGICGKASIEAIRNRGLHAPNRNFHISPEILCALPEHLREQQQVFGRTGGLHAAALFNGKGELLQLREDIGRHNAVDKVVGWALIAGMLPLHQHVLMISGRGGFEIIQKAIAAGIPVVASISAPSSLAVKLARELNLTLVGFLRGRRFVIYAGPERCLSS